MELAVTRTEGNNLHPGSARKDEQDQLEAGAGWAGFLGRRDLLSRWRVRASFSHDGTMEVMILWVC